MKQTAYTIPLQPGTPQKLNVVLEGVEYTFRLVWNSYMGCWVMDIGDSTGAPIVQGVAVTTGADLLEQFKYLGITGKLIAQTTNNVNAVPTFSNLGISGNLFYVVTT